MALDTPAHPGQNLPWQSHMGVGGSTWKRPWVPVVSRDRSWITSKASPFPVSPPALHGPHIMCLAGNVSNRRERMNLQGDPIPVVASWEQSSSLAGEASYQAGVAKRPGCNCIEGRGMSGCLQAYLRPNHQQRKKLEREWRAMSEDARSPAKARSQPTNWLLRCDIMHE